MWKFVLILLVTAAAIFVAQLVTDPPVTQQPRIGVASETPALMYGGIRG